MRCARCSERRAIRAYRYDGKTDRQIVRELMTGAGIDAATVDSRMNESSRSTCADSRRVLPIPSARSGLYPGVPELIDAIEARDDAVLGLLTGNVEQGARMKLEAAGLDFERFVVNAFGSDHETRGRLPTIAHERMRDTFGVSLAGRDVVVIGDTPSDIDCGRSLGARAIGVATGRYTVAELSEHDPFAVFENLSDTEAVMRAIVS